MSLVLRLIAAVAAAQSVMCSAVLADPGDYTITGALGLDSVSVFRGSKSDKLNPSVYAVFEMENDHAFGGFFVTPSSIQGEVTPLLVGYGAWTPSVAGFETKIGGRYYSFPGSSPFVFDLDQDGTPEKIGQKGLFEAFVSASRNIGTVKVTSVAAFSPNMFGETGRAYYYSTAIKAPIAKGFNLEAHVGRSQFENDLYNDDYVDYAFGITKSLFGFDLYVRYSDTAYLDGVSDEIVTFGIERAFTIASSENDFQRYLKRKIRNDLNIEKTLLFGHGGMGMR